MRFSITTEVDAPPEVVFTVLSEVERWPEWTPTVTRVERLGNGGAALALGSRLRIVQPKVPPAEWTVTALEPGRGFRLVSRSPGATVEANHWAEPTGGAQRSRLTLSVTFAGFLGRIIGWLMRRLNERYLAQEAAGLKRRSEERDKAAMRDQYAALWQLFAGYYNQDWALDDQTADDVLRRFVRDEPLDTVRRARREIEDVLGRWPTEPELEALTQRLGSYYRPAGDGLTTRDWLVYVGQFLARAG